MVRKFKYSIKKSKKDGLQVYSLLKNEEVLFVSESYYEVADLIASDGVEFSDDEILRNIQNIETKINEDKLIQLDDLYQKPNTATDSFLTFLIILSFIGYFIITFFSPNGVLGGGLFSFIVSTFGLITSLVIFGSILTSRKTDRNLMDRLDKIEKKLGIYKKLDEDK
jgi:hypothetical protein